MARYLNLVTACFWQLSALMQAATAVSTYYGAELHAKLTGGEPEFPVGNCVVCVLNAALALLYAWHAGFLRGVPRVPQYGQLVGMNDGKPVTEDAKRCE